MIRLLVTSFAITLTLVGCGGSKDKLTAEQKQEFTSTLESAGRSNKVAKQSQRAAFLGAATTKSPEQDMLEKISSDRCDHHMVQPDGFDAGKFDFTKPIEFGYTVAGANCPIAFKYWTVQSLSQDGVMKMGLELSYSVKDPQFKELNDVYAMSLKGEITAGQESENGEFSGSLSSKTHGEIKTGMKLESGKDSGTMSFTWDFPKFSVELVATASGNKENPKFEYTLNGEKLTQKEFEELMAKGPEIYSDRTQKDSRRQGMFARFLN